MNNSWIIQVIILLFMTHSTEGQTPVETTTEDIFAPLIERGIELRDFDVTVGDRTDGGGADVRR
jgi:hypothetical protein